MIHTLVCKRSIRYKNVLSITKYLFDLFNIFLKVHSTEIVKSCISSSWFFGIYNIQLFHFEVFLDTDSKITERYSQPLNWLH